MNEKLTRLVFTVETNEPRCFNIPAAAFIGCPLIVKRIQTFPRSKRGEREIRRSIIPLCRNVRAFLMMSDDVSRGFDSRRRREREEKGNERIVEWKRKVEQTNAIASLGSLGIEMSAIKNRNLIARGNDQRYSSAS